MKWVIQACLASSVTRPGAFFYWGGKNWPDETGWGKLSQALIYTSRADALCTVNTYKLGDVKVITLKLAQVQHIMDL